MAWYNFWKKVPEPIVEEPVVEELVPSFVDKSSWRNNMWVMTQYGVGVLFEYAQMSTVHLVDVKTGLTVGNPISVPLAAMRQALLKEIPECRRVGLDQEKAHRLGYF